MGDPAIELRGPSLLWRGVTAEIVLEVEPAHPIEVAGIEIRIRAVDGWRIFGHNTLNEQVHLFGRRRLMGRALLQAERHRFPFQVTPPSAMAPTHRRAPAFSQLDVLVIVKNPRFWRSDVRKAFSLHVREPPPARIARTSATVRTPLATPGKAYLELSLAATELVAGEQLLGSCAVFHVDDSRPQQIQLSLVPQFQLYGGSRNGAEKRDGFGHSLRIPMPAGSAGEALPFRFIVPPDITTTFHVETHALTWRFSASLGGIRAAIPVVIHDASAATRTTPLVEVPAVADRRVAALFAELEPWGWRPRAPEDIAIDDARFVIERDDNDVVLTIAYVYRGARGTYLIGTVAYRSLGLDLSVSRSSLVQQVFSNDIQVDIAAWDRAHFVMARYANQARAMLRVAVPTLQELTPAITSWNDELLVLEQPISGLDQKVLSAMVDDLAMAAIAIDNARDAISPPPSVVVDLARWAELARLLHGECVVGDLSISGQLGLTPVEVGLSFDDSAPPRVMAIRVAVGDSETASAAARAVSIQSKLPCEGDRGAHAAVAELLRQWPLDFIDLDIEDGVALASLRLPWSTAPVIDAGRVRELVYAVAAVHAALDPGAGPYR